MLWAYILENEKEIKRNNQPLFLLINEMEIGVDNIYSDLDGSDKVELKKLLDEIEPESTFLIRSVEDIADTLSELLEVFEILTEKHISLCSCCEPFLCGEDYLENLRGFINLQKAFADRKKKIGYEKALAEGRVGRPSKGQDIKKVIGLYEKGLLTMKQVESLTGVSKSTIYRYLKGGEDGAI